MNETLGRKLRLYTDRWKKDMFYEGRRDGRFEYSEATLTGWRNKRAALFQKSMKRVAVQHTSPLYWGFHVRHIDWEFWIAFALGLGINIVVWASLYLGKP